MKKISLSMQDDCLLFDLVQEEDRTDTSLSIFDGDYSEMIQPKSNSGLNFSLNLAEFVTRWFSYLERTGNGSSESVGKFVIYQKFAKHDAETGEIIDKEFALKATKQTEVIFDGVHRVQVGNDEAFVSVYLTKKGAVAVSINKESPSTQYLMYKGLFKLDIDEKKIRVNGKFTTNRVQIENAKVTLVERAGSHSMSIPVSVALDKKTTLARQRYQFDFTAYSNQIFKFLKQLDRTEELSLDFFFEADIAGTDERMSFRVGNPKFLTNYFMKNELAYYDEGSRSWYSMVPYFTLKGTNLSFTFNVYEKEAYDYYRANKNNWGKVAKQGENKNIWIIGERSYKAQDNGYFFFKYLRENHPEIEAYYVIRRDSNELHNVAPLGNILYFNSKEHFEKVMQAKYICGTHHPDSLYPIRSRGYVNAIKAKKVFLQHGVFGTKNIAPIYAKSVNEFYTDLFITSSDKEKKIAMTDLGYADKEVAVTGLARFDELFKQNVPVKRQLLIIPTWRDWITNNEIFEASEYLQRYRDLLFDPRLKEYRDKNNVEIIFCLHPNMQDYFDYFKDAPVTLIKQGEVNVQSLIKESMAMLTDYSSVAFDFSFLHKPVVYYQFDRNHFLGKFPSHLDLDEELPGDISDNLDGVFAALNNIAAHDFKMAPEYVTRADKFIKYRDTNAGERIYNAVLAIPDKSAVRHFFEDDTLWLRAKNKFRRTRKVYFPTMKAAYKWMSHFDKVVPNRVLFESSLGKRYEDSPRAIYEAMVRDGVDMEYIWVSNTNEPLKVNSKTKIIKRLSPDYYKYLATSQYWVNNQNFPTYIVKRKETKYLQTWHGTPLKKMQHDLEVVEGRDEGYLDRVTKAKDQWSALVSPSAYATKAFRSAFKYDGPVIEKGYPRNDVFFSANADKMRRDVRKRLGISDNQKVVLYAPTFRDYEKSGSKFTFDNQIDFEGFENKLGDDYVLLMREHVIVASKLKIPEGFRHNIIDVSSYPSVQELMLASDMLVTDYSSIMFDYLDTGKPMFFFCYDLEKYLELRGVYFDFTKEVPGPIVNTSDDLYLKISNLQEYWNCFNDKYKDFKSKFAPLDNGKASIKVYKEFFNNI